MNAFFIFNCGRSKWYSLLISIHGQARHLKICIHSICSIVAVIFVSNRCRPQQNTWLLCIVIGVFSCSDTGDKNTRPIVFWIFPINHRLHSNSVNIGMSSTDCAGIQMFMTIAVFDPGTPICSKSLLREISDQWFLFLRFVVVHLLWTCFLESGLVRRIVKLEGL